MDAPTSQKSEYPGFYRDAATLGDGLRRRLQHSLGDIQIPDTPEGQQFRESLQSFWRLFDPWPDWALRIAVEVISVHVPTIPKQLVSEVIRFFHDLNLVARLDGSDRESVRLELPKLDEQVLSAIIGHVIAHIFAQRDTARALLEELRIISKGRLTDDRYNDYLRRLDGVNEINGLFSKFLNKRPTTNLSKFMASSTRAQERTFDVNGHLRTTTATDIYDAILRNWPKVEMLAGPSQLCDLLAPVLKGSGGDPVDRLDRVKKICTRMGIRFKCQGTRPPPRLVPET
jgi:hypothetical protein